MALREIKKAFEKNVYLKLHNKIARDESSKRHAHTIKLNIPRFSAAMVKGINEAAKVQGITSAPANSTNVSTATTTVINRWKNGKYGKEFGGYKVSGISAYGNRDDFVIQRLSKKAQNDSTYARKVNQAFRAQVVQEWTGLIEGKAPDINSSSLKTIGLDADFSHSKDTSVANAALLMLIKDSKELASVVEVQSQYSRTDIAKKVLADLGIKWKRTEELRNGKKELVWVIEGELGGPNPKAGDPNYVKDEAVTKEWNDKVLKQLEQLIAGDPNSPFMDASYVASDPFTHKIATWEQKRIADEFLKKAGFTKGGQKIKVKNVPKKPKASKRQGAEKSKKPTVQSVATKILAMGVKPVAKKEKGQGKQASTSQSAELVKLKKYIQGRLPAEVRRNMGRPALQNRTGRFSNSVQLLSLTEAKNSLMAKYTYLLSPYETFENKGKKRWPMAYNPKPLIAKSIRNLAQGRIEQKLTVRRV